MARIALLTGSLPGFDVCGVGDYTKHLHEHLKGRVELVHRPIDSLLQPDLFEVFRDRDLVHVEYPTEGWGNSLLPSALPLARRVLGRRAKLVLTLHEWTHMNRLRRTSIAPLVRGADGFIFVSPTELRTFVGGAGAALRRKPRWHIPIGVNTKVPEITRAEVAEVRGRELGGRHDLLLTHFGFIHPIKQPEKLLAVVAELARRGRRPKLVFVGGFQSGKDADERALRAEVARRGLQGSIDMRGFVFDDRVMATLIAAGDASLALYADGLSRRRGSFWYPTQLGCHVVSTRPEDEREFEGDEQAIAPPHVRLIDADAAPEVIAGLLAELPPYEPLRFPPTVVAEWEEIGEAHLRLYDELLSDAGGRRRRGEAS